MTNKKKTEEVYFKSIDSYKLQINFKDLSNDLYNLLQNNLSNILEGKCNNNGLIKKNSVKIITHSSGELIGNKIQFDIIYESLLTNPIENMIIECKISSVTKVGIRAILNNDDSNPYVVFLSRDHHYNNKLFSEKNIGDIINVKVLGKRFELYDENISIIGELL
tara:strand:+ start:21351 stop:21842 length:492 start_codon:yes stop_codon:yes gene_type:complete